jgi:hypothetical protein
MSNILPGYGSPSDAGTGGFGTTRLPGGTGGGFGVTRLPTGPTPSLRTRPPSVVPGQNEAVQSGLNAALAAGQSAYQRTQQALRSNSGTKMSLVQHHISPEGEFVKAYVSELHKHFKLDQATALKAAGVAFNRSKMGIARPDPALGVINRVLSAPAEALAGYTAGFVKAEKQSPWNFLHANVAGVKEAGHAVAAQKMAGDYIRQAAPNNPVLANKWVGLTLSTVFDPVMYLSFGATGPTKVIASRLLAHQTEAALTDANRIIHTESGLYRMADGTTHKFNDPLELMMQIKHDRGMAIDLPDAMDQLRATGLQQKAALRRGQGYTYPDWHDLAGQEAKASPLRVAGAYIFPTAVRGGRGMRFAGLTVPGTKTAGEKLGAGFRSVVGRRAIDPGTDPVAGAIVHGFMTNPRFRFMGEDTVRALGLTELATWKAEQQGAFLEAKQLARTAAKAGGEKFTKPGERAGAHLAEPPIIEHPGDLKRVAGRYGETDIEGFHTAPTVEGSKAFKNVHMMSRKIVEGAVERGKALKIPEQRTMEMWDRIAAETQDPVEAIGKFWFSHQIEVRAREFEQRILKNPLFARPIKEGERIPTGYVPYTDKVTGHKFMMLEDMSLAMDSMLNPAILDKSTKSVMDALMIPQNYWKQFATSANPSFHVMNFLGAFWNNMFGMLYNPGDYLRAASTLYRSRMEEAVLDGRARYMGRAARSTEKTKGANELFRQAQVRGATSETASIYAEIQRGLEGGVQHYGPEASVRGKEWVKSLALPREGEKARRYALRQTRRATAAGMLATGNPLGVALLAPEAARVGRIAGTTIEDVVRLAPFMKAAKDPVVAQMLEAFGPITVPGMVHEGFTKPEQAAMYDIGAALSKHFQFDYQDLTEFERRFAKTIFPFYTFYRKNFVLQAQLLATAPRGVHTAQAVMNFLNNNGDVSGPMQELLPDYFDQIAAFQVPVPKSLRKRLGLPADQPLYLNPKLPFLSLNLMPDIWDVFRDTGQPTAQKVLQPFAAMIGSIGPFSGVPFAKPMLEAVVGTQLGLNKTIDYQRGSSQNWRNSWVPAPSYVALLPKPMRDFLGVLPWMDTVQSKRKGGGLLMTATGAYILDQISTPFITNLGQAIPTGGDDPDKARADLVSWMTGVRLIPVDVLQMHRSWAYRLRSELQAKKQDLKDQGKDLDNQDAHLLDRVNQQVDILERSWDRKQTAMFGPERRR